MGYLSLKLNSQQLRTSLSILCSFLRRGHIHMGQTIYISLHICLLMIIIIVNDDNDINFRKPRNDTEFMLSLVQCF